MIRRKWTAFKIGCIVCDFFLVLTSYFWAFTLRHDVMGGFISVDGRSYIHLALLYAACVVLLYYVLHVYEIHRIKKVGGNIARIAIADAIGIALLMAVFFSTKIVHVSRLAIMILLLLETALVSVRCTVFAWMIGFLYKQGRLQRHYVVVGNGLHAQQYMEDVRRDPYQAVVVVGYVGRESESMPGKCLGAYEELAEVVAKTSCDGLIVALGPHEIQFMKYVMDIAGKEGLYLQMIPFFHEFYPAHPTFELVGNTKLINLRATPLDNVSNALIKRCMDFFGSLVLIVLTSPVMLVLAIGVRLSGPGPVIFCQERIGKDKKPFVMHKFRSMNVGAEKEGAGWTVSNDARRTRFGSFIRKYSLDELPQLFDVLVGHMSLVGPRPEVPRYVRQFKEDVPLYLVRQQVRPGMTGWAQIHGLRGDSSIEERVKYDIWYIENWSLFLDIRILLRTAFGGMKNDEVLK